jgi:hypothetical protein
MHSSSMKPTALARRAAGHLASGRGVANNASVMIGDPGPWRRETFSLPRTEARQKARDIFDRFPKAAYMTEIEFWRELDDGRIEFTIRRLPTAD